MHCVVCPFWFEEQVTSTQDPIIAFKLLGTLIFIQMEMPHMGRT